MFNTINHYCPIPLPHSKAPLAVDGSRYKRAAGERIEFIRKMKKQETLPYSRITNSLLTHENVNGPWRSPVDSNIIRIIGLS